MCVFLWISFFFLDDCATIIHTCFVFSPPIGHSHFFVFFFFKNCFSFEFWLAWKKKGKKCFFFFFWFCFHKISDPVSLISLYSDCVTKRKKNTLAFKSLPGKHVSVRNFSIFWFSPPFILFYYFLPNFFTYLFVYFFLQISGS